MKYNSFISTEQGKVIPYLLPALSSGSRDKQSLLCLMKILKTL